MSLVIDIQCFCGFHNALIIKEMAIVDVKNQSFHHWIVKPPFSFYELSKPLRKHACWLSNAYHGMDWESGFITYTELYALLHSLNPIRVYVKGEEKRKLISQIFKFYTEVINMDDLNCPSLKTMPMPSIRCYHHANDYKYMCALSNVFHLWTWLRNEYKTDFELSSEK